ncbi:MAG: caspase family protein [Ignavibacteria bacterium]|nr:caspase family protein [Ignavibacteria bacterium]
MKRILLFVCVLILSSAATHAAKPLEITLRVNKSAGETYRAGEKIIVTVRASMPCHVQLVYHDAAKQNFLIFPNNGSAADGRVDGTKDIVLGRGTEVDGFEFEVTAPFGGEMLRAYASTRPLPKPAGDVLDGGMVRLTGALDALDVAFHDQAFKAGAQLTSATVLIKTAPAEIAKGARDIPGTESRTTFAAPRIFGLVVGVSRYASAGIKSLRYADADARMVADFLQAPEGAGIPKERLRVLLNEDATRDNVLDAIRGFLAGTTRNDLVFIYFAGHGITSPEKNATYFLSTDANLSDLARSAVDQAEITTLLTERVKAGKVVFFLDACHGGGLGLTGVRMRGANTVLSGKLLTELLSKKNGTAFLTASRSMEQSQEGARWGGGHGVFTYRLVEGLRKAGDLNGDGRVTIDELAEYVGDAVKKDTDGRQHPELKGHFDNELVLSILR